MPDNIDSKIVAPVSLKLLHMYGSLKWKHSLPQEASPWRKVNTITHDHNSSQFRPTYEPAKLNGALSR